MLRAGGRSRHSIYEIAADFTRFGWRSMIKMWRRHFSRRIQQLSRISFQVRSQSGSNNGGASRFCFRRIVETLKRRRMRNGNGSRGRAESVFVREMRNKFSRAKITWCTVSCIRYDLKGGNARHLGILIKEKSSCKYCRVARRAYLTNVPYTRRSVYFLWPPPSLIYLTPPCSRFMTWAIKCRGKLFIEKLSVISVTVS